MSRVATQNTRFQLRNGGTGEPVQRNQFAAEQWGAFTYVLYTWGIDLPVLKSFFKKKSFINSL